VIGVLGGMGPLATADFFAKVIAATEAQDDAGHVPLLIHSDPRIPGRPAALLHGGASPLPALLAARDRLIAAGAQGLVMACNTAHAWEADIRAAITVPFVSMIDTTVAAVADLRPEAAGVLAVDACLSADLYQSALKKAGVRPILLPADSQKTFMELIYRVKSGDTGETVRRAMATLGRRLEAQGAEVLIAGCTEIPLVLTADDIEGELVSSTDALVERTILLAGAELKG
jgi:aspartate racemase